MPTPYEAPLALIRAAIDQAARAVELSSLPGWPEAFGDTADAVLQGAARLARDVLSPLNATGDAASSRLIAEGVVTPKGFPEAYRRFCADGWPTICAPQEFGGQGLPMLLGAAVTETWGGANLAFAMCPEAANGAVEALRLHAAPALRERYLPPLVSGEWTASMCLTEPQAGSDLSTIRTLAEPDGDGWRLAGRKIFISWGDHDLADNIVHLVLARTAGAPAGLGGISLFLVPKMLPPDVGEPPAAGREGLRNDIHAVSLEHKMGIRASPTCVMALGEHGGARGWLVGPLNGGLACLFTMMNHMRIGVGLHSTGLAERAWQLARSYAQERRQGRDAAGAQRPIIEHQDVRRMLLTMKALTHGARCLAYHAAATLDVTLAKVGEVDEVDKVGEVGKVGKVGDEAVRERARRRLALLTPLVKAWCSDVAVEVSSLGVQVHGGTGYIEDSEISQVYRDARIGPLFEGTNYIQAQDLLVRRVIRDRGAALEELLAEMERAARNLEHLDTPAARPAGTSLVALSAPLLAECAHLRAAARRIVDSSGSQPDLPGCVAYPFLQWLAVVAGGWQWALAAHDASRHNPSDPGGPGGLREPSGSHGSHDEFARAMTDCARFYGAHILPRARAYAAAVDSGTDILVTPRPAEI